MSSDRKINSSRANGAKSHGPTTPDGKKRSSQNAVQHGLLAECVLLTGEDAKNFEILVQNHKRRFQPADGIEFGIIEEMCSAYWRLHRVWTIETHTLNRQISTQPAGSPVLRLVNASSELASQPGTALMQRYETRLQNMYARAIRTFKVLRTIPVPDQDDASPDQENGPNTELPKEPSPISEHPVPAAPQLLQPVDSNGAANPGCSRHSGGYRFTPSATPRPPNPPATTPAPDAPPPPRPQEAAEAANGAGAAV
jgi:hypothetical protein